MKIKYEFNYKMYEAKAGFIVDTDIFKPEDAKEYLEFFSWDYDNENDPIEELMKKYAMRAIKVATAENCNEYMVKMWFAENDGFLIPIDGTKGIELIYVNEYEFDESCLYLEKTIIE